MAGKATPTAITSTRAQAPCNYLPIKHQRYPRIPQLYVAEAATGTQLALVRYIWYTLKYTSTAWVANGLLFADRLSLELSEFSICDCRGWPLPICNAASNVVVLELS
jgi:hypothetical protein